MVSIQELGTVTMPLSLTQERTLNELARHLYKFLPGQAHPYADQSISFKGVAVSLGLGHFWSGGSKRPAISNLLSQTLEHRSGQFCSLIIEVVRKGMSYSENKGEPITREEITRLNELVAGVGFKVPELWDRQFLSELPSTDAHAQERATPTDSDLAGLSAELLEMASISAVDRGFRFEKFLGKMFEAFGLKPRSPFRIVGEQIDGSLQFQGETYLVEATWRNERVGQEELLAFSGKVAGKAQWSRGLLISYSGFSEDGLEAFARGKPTNVVGMAGLDLHEILEQGLSLAHVLEQKVRRAAETNQAYVPVRSL